MDSHFYARCTIFLNDIKSKYFVKHLLREIFKFIVETHVSSRLRTCKRYTLSKWTHFRLFQKEMLLSIVLFIFFSFYMREGKICIYLYIYKKREKTDAKKDVSMENSVHLVCNTAAFLVDIWNAIEITFTINIYIYLWKNEETFLCRTSRNTYGAISV